MNNYGAGFLILTKLSQEEHSWSTRRLRWFRQEQTDKQNVQVNSCTFLKQVMKERDVKKRLNGLIQIDNDYRGGQHHGVTHGEHEWASNFSLAVAQTQRFHAGGYTPSYFEFAELQTQELGLFHS